MKYPTQKSVWITIFGLLSLIIAFTIVPWRSSCATATTFALPAVLMVAATLVATSSETSSDPTYGEPRFLSSLRGLAQQPSSSLMDHRDLTSRVDAQDEETREVADAVNDVLES